MKKMFGKTPKIQIVLWLLILFSAFSAFAQTRAQVANHLQQLERRLENVRQLVTAFDNRRAQDLVNKAQMLRDEIVAEADNRDLVAIDAKIRVAYAYLEQAVKITLSGPIARLRSQLEERMQRADHVVSGSRNKEAERLLKAAKTTRDAAEQALNAQQANKAVEQYRVALKLLDRALALVATGPAQNVTDLNNDFMSELRRKYENLKERAAELGERNGDPRIRQIYDQATKLALSAESAFREGNYDVARKYYNESTMLLLRVVDLSATDVSNQSRQLDNKLLALRELLDQVRNDLSAANKEALWKIQLCENLLHRTVAAADVDGNRAQLSDRLSEQVRQTHQEISEIRKKVTPTSPRDAEILIRMSEKALRKAEQALASGLSRVALEAVLTSQRLLTRAEGIITAKEAVSLKSEALAMRFAQLDAAISEAENNLDAKLQWQRDLLDSAKDIRNLAYDSYQSGNLRAAHEAVSVAFELVRKTQNTSAD
jgi:hypothetical protein